MTQKTSSPVMSRRFFLGTSSVVLMGAAGGWAVWSHPSFAGQSLSVQDAHQAMTKGEIILIDIRRPDEWQMTGIAKGAYPLDMRRNDFVTALDEITGGEKSAAVALICARGVRSARLSNRLEDAGYNMIINVPEGMLGSSAGPGWINAQLPVTPYQG